MMVLLTVTLLAAPLAAGPDACKLSSPSFPGLCTQYCLYQMEATVTGLPSTSFVSEVHPKKHAWEWRPDEDDDLRHKEGQPLRHAQEVDEATGRRLRRLSKSPADNVAPSTPRIGSQLAASASLSARRAASKSFRPGERQEIEQALGETIETALQFRVQHGAQGSAPRVQSID